MSWGIIWDTYRVYYPSIKLWAEEKVSPAEFFLSPRRSFRIDSKITGPQALAYYLSNHPKHWKCAGSCSVSKFEFSELQKKRWQQAVSAIIERSREFRRSNKIPVPMQDNVPLIFRQKFNSASAPATPRCPVTLSTPRDSVKNVAPL